ncbi:MAG: hypothetical protein EOP83_21460, partial [Verrucomicrobiaceae bacterium]
MENPLNSLGYRILNASLEAGSEDQSLISRLSRRGFLLTAATLSSCAAAEPLKPKPPVNPVAGPVKTPANTGYRTPPVQGPVPRNPDMELNSTPASS